MSTNLPPRCFALVALTALLQPVAAQCVPLAHSENTLPGVDGSVSALATWDPDGSGPLAPGVVVGGDFDAAGSLAATSIAFIDPSSGQWSSLGSLPIRVQSLAAGAQGRLYAKSPTALWRWTGSTWATISTLIDGSVSRMVELPNGNLVVAGEFFSINGVICNGLARWDGATWHAMGADLGNRAFDLELLGNGSLAIVGELVHATLGTGAVALWNNGAWTFVAGAPATAAAVEEFPNGDLLVLTYPQAQFLRWNGAAWTSFTVGGNVAASAFAITQGGDVVVGGTFATFAGQPANNIARWSGGTWSGLGSGMDNAVLSVVETPGGDVVAGGLFTAAGGASATRIARWNGTQWSSFGTGLDGPVQALLPLPTGDVIVGGAFRHLVDGSGAVTTGVARRTNGLWQALGGGTDSTVLSLAELPSGNIAAGGAFVQAGGVACNRVALWNGLTWQSLGTGMNGYVHALAAMANGDLAAGGYFTTAGGVAATGIARWNGVSWSAMGGFDGGVETLLVLPSGDLIAGGAFANVNFVPVNGVARFDGSTWHAMGSGLGLVRSLAFARGELYAFAGYTVSRWDGTAWQALPATGTPSTLGTLPNGDLALGTLGTGVMRWDGSSWSLLASVASANGVPRALASGARGELWVGGQFLFTGAAGSNSVASPFLASIDSSCPATATRYGIGCTGSIAPTDFSSSSLPWIGTTWRAHASAMPPLAPFAVGVFGVSSSLGVPLSLLIPQGQPNCSLLQNPDALFLLLAAFGSTQVAIPVPTNPAIVGLSFFTQVLPVEVDATGAITSITASNSIYATIGSF